MHVGVGEARHLSADPRVEMSLPSPLILACLSYAFKKALPGPESSLSDFEALLRGPGAWALLRGPGAWAQRVPFCVPVPSCAPSSLPSYHVLSHGQQGETRSRLCLVPSSPVRTTVLFLTPLVCPQLLWDTCGL